MHKHKLLLRAANDIHSQLQRLESRSAVLELPQHDWDDCQSVLRRMQRAESRGWYGAPGTLRKDLEWPLKRCTERLETLAQHLSEQERPSGIVRLHDIFSDLVALFEQFAEVEIDLSGRQLSVITDPIVLEDFYLGPFTIRLSWAQIGDLHPYDVIAREPNPPRCCEDTTHPHVRDTTLCEGEGQVPIRKALQAGRLLDFFEIVNRILNTYNAGSAYVSLSEWDGVSCVGCGELVDGDDAFDCYRCGTPLCSGCATECAACESSHCNECLVSCHNCRTSVCADCTGRCPGCSLMFCKECLKERGLCKACKGEQHATGIDRNEATAAQAAAATSSSAGEAA